MTFIVILENSLIYDYIIYSSKVKILHDFFTNKVQTEKNFFFNTM